MFVFFIIDKVYQILDKLFLIPGSLIFCHYFNQHKDKLIRKDINTNPIFILI